MLLIVFFSTLRIGKAKEMIKRANLLLSKAEPVRLEEIARLEQLRLEMTKSCNKS